MKKVLFRADSSFKIGTGHIMRDLVFAQQYVKKGYKVIFATRELKGNINHKILEAGYSLKVLPSNAKKGLVSLLRKLCIDLLVIDHYKIDYKKEKYIKLRTGVKILSFDDTYEKHYCDVLLNHNLGANTTRYKSLVPHKCELRCGSKYTLLRDEFHKEKKKKYTRPPHKRTIFLAMGGSDTEQLNIKVLKVLKKIPQLNVHLVTTSSNQKLQKLQNYCKDKKWIHLHIDSNKIAKLMVKSNFSIVTPSVTVNEVYYLSLPFIAIKTAKNQQEVYSYLKKKGYNTLAKFHAKKLKLQIENLLKNEDKGV